VDWVRDGNAADLALRNDVYDLILLDLGLPKQDGLKVLTRYRRRGGSAAILIVTATDALSARVQGLDAGADDYLVKPFDLDELFARVRALLRRGSGRRTPELSFAGLILNPATRKASYQDRDLNLSSREFSVLLTLMDHPGDVVSRRTLEEKLYGWGQEVESNTVEVYIHALRRKLGSQFIKTIRGVGYTL
jgi:DNA-binding response OmpR family regulator